MDLSKITFHITNKALLINSMAGISYAPITKISSVNIPVNILRDINSGNKHNGLDLLEYNKNNHQNTLNEEYYSAGNEVLYTFNIECANDMDVVVMTCKWGNDCLLWVNEEYVGPLGFAEVFKLKLSKGYNFFCFVFLETTYSPKLTVRINTFENEMNKPYTSMIEDNYFNKYGKIGILNIDYQWNVPSVYTGVVFCFDRINSDIEQNVRIELLSYYTDEIYYHDYIKFNQVFSISLLDLPVFNDKHCLNMYKVRATFHYKDGTERFLDRFFCFDSVAKCKNILKQEADTVFALPVLLDCTKKFIEFRLNNLLELADDDIRMHDYLLWLKSDLDHVFKNEYPIVSYNEGHNDIYYFSNIDRSIRNYAVYLPQNYDSSKKYPCIICCSSSVGCYISWILRDAKYVSNCIIVNINMRGVTVGSYVGEASYNEIWQDFRKRFLIDENYIGVFGYSSGASATWLISQLAPDRFSIIAPYAGNFNQKLIFNLVNLKVLDIESFADTDYWKIIQDAKAQLEKLPNYNLICGDTIPHILFEKAFLNRRLFETLSTTSKNNFPPTIEFTAISNRHLSAYWIRIHSIIDTATFGSISASIVSDNEISIKCHNVSGVTMQIPPQVTADRIKVNINQDTYMIERAVFDDISFVKCELEDRFVLGEENVSNFKLYHGNGLIDVYTTPLRILNCVPASELICECAQRFANPTMNTYMKCVDVCYPIYDVPLSQEQLWDIKDCSLVVLDRNSESNFAEQLRNLSAIKMDKHGYEYKSVKYTEKYCIMQIMKHPTNTNCSILYINANDEKLYERNLFTRSVILPSYLGKHPFLNVAALIYSNGKYKTIFEYGCDIQSVELGQ